MMMKCEGDAQWKDYVEDNDAMCTMLCCWRDDGHDDGHDDVRDDVCDDVLCNCINHSQ